MNPTPNEANGGDAEDSLEEQELDWPHKEEIQPAMRGGSSKVEHDSDPEPDAKSKLLGKLALVGLLVVLVQLCFIARRKRGKQEGKHV